MARYSEPKAQRAILNQYGLFIVKTKDMCTYHRNFEDAVESYGNVYGMVPVAGIVTPEVVPVKLKTKSIWKSKEMAALEATIEESRRLIEKVRRFRAEYKLLEERRKLQMEVA